MRQSASSFAVSGLLLLAALAAGQDSCSKPNANQTMFNQHDVAHYTDSESFGECCARCLKNPECNVYSWNPGNW